MAVIAENLFANHEQPIRKFRKKPNPIVEVIRVGNVDPCWVLARRRNGEVGFEHIEDLPKKFSPRSVAKEYIVGTMNMDRRS